MISPVPPILPTGIKFCNAFWTTFRRIGLMLKLMLRFPLAFFSFPCVDLLRTHSDDLYLLCNEFKKGKRITSWQFQLRQINSQFEFEYVRNLYSGCPSEFFLEMGCFFRFAFLSVSHLLFHMHLAGWFGLNCANSRQDYTTCTMYKEETSLYSNCFFLPQKHKYLLVKPIPTSSRDRTTGRTDSTTL